MRYSNLDKVNGLTRQLCKCQEAIMSLEKYSQENEDESGYNFYVARHSDGSGEVVDMTGCYIADESIEALKTVLYDKVAVVVAELEALGVSFGFS